MVVPDAPLMPGLDPQAASELERAATRQRVRRGDVLFREGDEGDRLYVITAGKVKISRAAPDGRENVVAVLGPGDMFGELSLFDPGPRTATATAVSGGEVAVMAHDELRPWLARHPDVAVALLGALARRVRRTTDTLADVVFTDVPGRVAKALLSLAERFGQSSTEGSVRVDHGLTQSELAQYVGASRETVNKALAEFASRGWLRVDGRAVVITDVERLANRAR